MLQHFKAQCGIITVTIDHTHVLNVGEILDIGYAFFYINGIILVHTFFLLTT